MATEGKLPRHRASFRNTHPRLITDDEAEAIIAQAERALQGRRVRDTPPRERVAAAQGAMSTGDDLASRRGFEPLYRP